MTRIEYQILEMLGRVLAFCQAYDARFAKDSLPGRALTAIEAAISKAYECAALQDPGQAKVHTSARAVAREELTLQLDSISRTARGVSIDYPGTEEKFWMPKYPRHDGALLEAGDRFAVLAEPLKAVFVEHLLPEDFIDRLKTAVGSFREAMRKQNKANSDRKGSYGQFSDVVKGALKQLERVESVVTNAFRDDKPALTAWEAARGLKRPRRTKSKPKPDPVVTQPGEASGSVAAEKPVLAEKPVFAEMPVHSEPPAAGEEAASTTVRE